MNHTELPTLLKSLLQEESIRKMAQEQGAVKRNRDFDPFLLVSILLLGFRQSRDRSLASLCRLYSQETDKPLSESSLRERFNPGLEAFFHALYLHLAGKICSGFQTQGLLTKFQDVFISDSTIVALQDSLQKLFPGVSTKAGLKIHLMLSAQACSPAQVKLGAASRSDHRQLVVKEWVRGKLLLMDLGYTSLALLSRIHKHGGYFVARVKENANPKVLESGQLLSEVLMAGKDGDHGCEFKYKTREYLGKKTQHTRQFRVVSLWNPNKQAWMRYVTNLSAKEFSGQEVGVLCDAVHCCKGSRCRQQQWHRARWLVELVFHELKTGYGLDQFRVRNPHAIKVLIYAALMTLLLSRQVLLAFCREIKLNSVALGCWWRMFCEAVPKLLSALLRPHDWNFEQEKRLKRLWEKELRRCSNKHMPLLEQVDLGIFYEGRLCRSL